MLDTHLTSSILLIKTKQAKPWGFPTKATLFRKSKSMKRERERERELLL
jgi:hypothetical protein